MAKKAAAKAEVKNIKVTLVKRANGILKNQKALSKPATAVAPSV